MRPQREIEGSTKFEAKDASGGYSCSCTNFGKNRDEVYLRFEDFFELMSAKITNQKRTSSLHTVFESKSETVSCILWPSGQVVRKAEPEPKLKNSNEVI
mmetsp:Transcript_46954/g.34379  ORF Transcript_46954/g.34379 Transcript_46954/m.34379 type:complete len:99 (+) Transcript_46954:329-625(+)